MPALLLVSLGLENVACVQLQWAFLLLGPRIHLTFMVAGFTVSSCAGGHQPEPIALQVGR